MDLITILCSVYNREEYIEETIISIIKQSYVNFEFLIVDDWSCDNSYEILKKYRDIDSRIKIWTSENKGLHYQYNFLLEKMSKDSIYTAWIDSDDIYVENNLLDRMIFVKKQLLDGCWNNLTPIDEKWMTLEYWVYFRNIFSEYRLDEIDKLFLTTFLSNKWLPLSYWTIFIKSRVLKKIWIIKSTKNIKEFAGDVNLLFRLNLFANIRYLDDNLLLYRKHSKQITTINEKIIIDEFCQTLYYFYKNKMLKKSTLVCLLKIMKSQNSR